MRKEPDVPFLNKTDERIPPGALMVPGTQHDEDGAIWVTKPDADSMPGLLVNGEFSVEPDKKGGGTFGPQVALAFTGAAPEAGDTLGSQDGSWLAKVGNFGWVPFGGEDADFGMVNAVRDGTGSPESGGGGGGGGSTDACWWLAELANIGLLRMRGLSKNGMCACIDNNQFVPLVRDFDADPTGGTWVGAFGATWEDCFQEFTVKVLLKPCEVPCLILTTTTGASVETEYKLWMAGCNSTTKKIWFAGSGTVHCDGDATPCAGNDTFMVVVECAPLECAAPGLPRFNAAAVFVHFPFAPTCYCWETDQDVAIVRWSFHFPNPSDGLDYYLSINPSTLFPCQGMPGPTCTCPADAFWLGGGMQLVCGNGYVQFLYGWSYNRSGPVPPCTGIGFVGLYQRLYLGDPRISVGPPLVINFDNLIPYPTEPECVIPPLPCDCPTSCIVKLTP